MRKPFRGTWNIIRFNWHFYVGAVILLLGLYLLAKMLSPGFSVYINSLICLIILSVATSLLVSLYVYDISALYQLSWLNSFNSKQEKLVVNIHAGFDETSTLLVERFGKADLTVLDFYDPLKHTEVSIKRARKAYPPFPDTQKVKTTKLPLGDAVADNVFVFFSAHEIRDAGERIAFFRELNRILKPDGRVVVTEHLRDWANFIAYNIGFFHFYSKASWQETFFSSSLQLQKGLKITPFVSSFILVKNGVAP